jgi:signal transduction histidine kinase
VRRRLILVALAIASMVALAFLVPLGVYVRRYSHDQAMVAASQDAREVSSYASFIDDPSRLQNTLRNLGYSASPNDIVVWYADGRRLGVASKDTTGQPPASVKTMLDRGPSNAVNSRTRMPGGLEILYPTTGVQSGFIVVRVFVPNDVLYKDLYRQWVPLAAVALALILAGVAVADRLATAIVKPVKELASVTRRLSAGESDARTTPGGPPEIADVGGAVNHLADRIDDLLAAERETLADLSHRLRTPLAALRLDADGLAGTEIGERIMADIEAMEAAVSNVIREVRAPKRAADVSCDLVDVARTRCEFWQVLAEDDEREWSVHLPSGAAWVPLKRDDLAIALDQVMTNAFTYTPEGTPIRVVVTPGSGEVTLTVDDDGPGFPDGFEIKRGESQGGSTGLGLDIVQRTVRAVGGRLTLTRAPSGGARVQMTFPLRGGSSTVAMTRRGPRGGRPGTTEPVLV